MLRPEQIETYRRMTVAERLRLTIELIEFAESALASLPPAERDRRLQIVFEQNAASNEELRRRLASS